MIVKYQFILIFIAVGICLIMGVGWLELTLLYVGIELVLLNGFYRNYHSN